MAYLRRQSVKHLWASLVALWMLAAAAAAAELDSQAKGIINSGELRQATVGLMAVDADNGDVLIAVNVDQAMIPASNMKLITSAAALRVLGPDFMFKTDLELIDANPEAAVLVVHGDGDPAFGDPKLLQQHGYQVEQLLETWVAAVRGAGVRRVAALIVDDRVFDRQFVHEDWPANQLNEWYCAQVSGLNFHDNCLDLFLKPSRPGQAPTVTMRPEAPFLDIINRAVTGDADTFWVSRRLESNMMTYRGKVKTARTAPVSVTLHDPAMFFGQLLADRLTRAQLPVAVVRRVADDENIADGRTLHRVQTALPVVLARCNKDSQNLFAEALLKRMGYQITGAAGSWNNGAAAVRRVLHERLGARGSAINVADGSGLSRGNRVSPHLMVDLLVSMHQDPQLGPIYLQSLSVGGEDGTLAKRFRNDMNGQVYAKSGYISEVSTLSGYLVFRGEASAQPERTIAFCLFFNGFKPPVYAHQVKQVQNKLVELLDQRGAPRTANLGG